MESKQLTIYPQYAKKIDNLFFDEPSLLLFFDEPSLMHTHYIADKQAVQEYKQHRLASACQSPSADAVLITKADLEGYHSSCDTVVGKELAIINRVTRSRPMIAKLSCLFASLKVSGSYTPVTRQLTEARAC